MNETELVKLLDHSIDGVVAFDRRRCFTFWSAAMERIFGIPRSAVLGKLADEVLPFLRDTGELEYFAKTLAGESPVATNRHFVTGGRRGGQKGFFDAYYSPFRAEDGTVVGGVAIVRDVTLRRNAELRIDESERRFQAMADLSPVLLWMAREDSMCDFFNASWLNFTGRTMEQEMGVGWVEGVHFEDFQRCVDTYEAAFSARQVFEVEYRLRRADGEFRWILDRGGPRYDRDGTFLGYIGSCVDITDRRNAETALRSSLQQLQAILENAGEGIVCIDGDARIQSFNPAAERLFGYSVEEVLGKSVRILELGDDDGILSTIRVLGRHTEVIGRRKDGSTFPMEVAIGVAGGREAPTTLILRDIFERRSAERVVLDASEELQRRIGQDLHDGLGQLLTGTAFLAKDLERALIGDHAARVKRLVDLLNQAIDQVRTLAKGLSPLHLEKYELAMVLGELARDTTQMFGVECRFEGIEPAGCDDLITRTHLYRIAREAVLNAIKHGGATRIDISLASAGERFALSIRDNGTGIARDLARGGIGLPSMRHRARMLGGQLEVGERKPSGVEVVCLFSPTPARS